MTSWIFLSLTRQPFHFDFMFFDQFYFSFSTNHDNNNNNSISCDVCMLSMRYYSKQVSNKMPFATMTTTTNIHVTNAVTQIDFPFSTNQQEARGQQRLTDTIRHFVIHDQPRNILDANSLFSNFPSRKHTQS